MSKAIFWDLQGTLGGEATADINLFEPFEFAKKALQITKNEGFRNIIITNQSRIGKGLLSLEDYEREAQKIITFFNNECTLIDDFLCCPHKNEDECECKRPKTALIMRSVEKYSLSVKECYVIGDIAKNEILMAHNAGCKGILVLTGGGKDSLGRFRSTWAGYEADLITENAFTAAKAIANGSV